MAGRTGLPTTTARALTEGGAFSSVGKAQATAVARAESMRLARPMTAFCSWITVGRRVLKAASIAGTEG